MPPKKPRKPRTREDLGRIAHRAYYDETLKLGQTPNVHFVWHRTPAQDRETLTTIAEAVARACGWTAEGEESP